MTNAARISAGSTLALSSLLFVVHAFNDAFSAILSVLLPSLQVRFGLTETVLAAFVATLSFSSSVTQPIFGVWVDRYGRRLMAGLGILTSSVLLSLIAVAPHPAWLFVLLFLGGLGSAAFHPAGTALARHLGGPRKGLAVSLFSSGGTLGIAMGPLLIGALIVNDMVAYSPWLMLPGLIGAVLIFRFMPASPRQDPRERKPLFDVNLLRGPVGALALSGILRSISFTTFANSVPLWLVGTRGVPLDAPIIFWTLTVFSFSAGVGGILVGFLERRVSRQILISGSMVAALVPLFALFIATPGTALYYVVVAAAGALVNGGLPLMIVAGQDLAPHNVGAATGLLMGFTWGTAGVLYIGIGALQETLGMQPAMMLAFLTMIPAAMVSLSVLRRHRDALDGAQAPNG